MVSLCFYWFYVFLFVQRINIFRVEILPTQPPLPHFWGVSLYIYYYYYVILMFQNISSWDRIRLFVCIIQRINGQCYLRIRYISPWRCYGLKPGIPWKFGFSSSLFSIIWCLPVHENNKHVQYWNPTTTTSFPGRHNNNTNNREKPNKQLWGERKQIVFVWF